MPKDILLGKSVNMRFRKGSKVEVLSKKEVPAGSWRPAEIICGSGHYYTVRYDKFEGGNNQTIVERVSRKAIRPCPPAQEVLENWMIPGDVVEVFSDRSWKMATVSEVLGKNNFLVRLLGSSCEFKVGKFDIRARRSWQDDKWVLVQKRSCNRADDSKEDKNGSPTCYDPSSQIQKINSRKHLHLNVDNLSVNNKNSLESQNICNFETRKRGSNYDNFQGETIAGAGLKCRALEKKRKYHGILNEYIHSVAIQKDVPGDKLKDASLDRTGISEMNGGRKKQTDAAYCSFEENIELKNADRVTCSVGSCSISNSDHHGLPLQISMGRNEDTDGSMSDTGSSSAWGYGIGNVISRNKGLEAEIHRLELHAYRRTLAALYASGPLSWEKELLLTDLRLSLHISNDEHLMQIKNLVSKNTAFQVDDKVYSVIAQSSLYHLEL